MAFESKSKKALLYSKIEGRLVYAGTDRKGKTCGSDKDFVCTSID
jgi:hypothetical protein